MSHQFFQNTACPYFPCHQGAAVDTFNCLFCYCPLYALGRDCGGNPTYTPEGVKDCSGCLLPHLPAGYQAVLSRFDDLAQLAKEKDTPSL